MAGHGQVSQQSREARLMMLLLKIAGGGRSRAAVAANMNILDTNLTNIQLYFRGLQGTIEEASKRPALRGYCFRRIKKRNV
eukprot:jgi/Mesen1/10347/ME000008S10127